MNLAQGKYWDQSWSPIRGCSHTSPGCDHCWAERFAARFSGTSPNLRRGEFHKHGEDRGRKIKAPFSGFAHMTRTGSRWTGRVQLIESELTKPMHWKTPNIVALNWMGDLFHEKVPDEAIDRVFAIMALCPQHKFLVLTKRAKKMQEYLDTSTHIRVNRIIDAIHKSPRFRFPVGRSFPRYCEAWPLPNVILGVSIEDQQRADELIPDLLATPAAMRWVSAEPMLGTINLARYLPHDADYEEHTASNSGKFQWKCRKCGRVTQGAERRCVTVAMMSAALGWVVCGGESGLGARPMHPDWVRNLRDQCQVAGVPFLFKQHGHWLHESQFGADGDKPTVGNTGCSELHTWSDGTHSYPVGKTAAGRLLDGRTWDELPEVV